MNKIMNLSSYGHLQINGYGYQIGPSRSIIFIYIFNLGGLFNTLIYPFAFDIHEFSLKKMEKN